MSLSKKSNLIQGITMSLVILILALMIIGCESSPEAGKSSLQEVSDIQSMQKRTDGRFDVICQDGSREVVGEMDILNNEVCTAEIPNYYSGAIYGRSDSCSQSEIVAVVNEYTNCSELSSTDIAWSIKVGGQCRNIPDTNVQKACFLIKAEGSDVIYGRSDSCSDDTMIGAVDEFTDCNQFSETENAWSIKVGGQCQNISDTNAKQACMIIKGKNHDVIYGRSDSCDDDDMVAIVEDHTNCQSLSNTDIAWSIKVDGQCKNISDTNVRHACLIIKSQDANIIYGRSDSCSDDHMVAFVDYYTNCDDLSSSEVAWSIKVNNRCKNISDTDVRKACLLIKSEGF